MNVSVRGKRAPSWAEHGSLANTVVNQADNGFLPAVSGYDRARRLYQHALQVSPDLIQARAGLAYVHLSHDWDWQATTAELRPALDADPTDPSILNVAGKLSATLGRWDEAERQFRLALVRDPLDGYLVYNLAHVYYLARRLAESEKVYQTLLELEPNFAWTRAYLAKTLVAEGKAEQALEILRAETDEGNRILYLPVVLRAVGRRADSDQALREMIARWADTAAFYVAQNYAYQTAGRPTTRARRPHRDIAAGFPVSQFASRTGAASTRTIDPISRSPMVDRFPPPSTTDSPPVMVKKR